MSESRFIVEVTRENYEELMQASFEVPVLMDFWAGWCQPCQVLMPVLAKLAEEYQGKFLLGKLNTEEEQEIAAQFGIRSIPTVKLIKEGRPVDEFLGALPENEVRHFLDRHLPRESDAQVLQAQRLLHSGDAEAALTLLERAHATDPANHRATLALAEVQAATGDIATAEATLAELPLDEQEKPEVAALRSLLFFEGIVGSAPSRAALEARLASHPNDSEARHQLAAHRVKANDYEGAMELLLELMRNDRTYGDDAARKTLVKLFDLLGDDPLVGRYRARMASLLY